MDNNIQFDEPEYTQPAAYHQKKGPSGLTGLVIRLKLAKNEEGAQKVLLIIITICILIIIVSWLFQAGNSYVLYKLPVVPPQPPAS